MSPSSPTSDRTSADPRLHRPKALVIEDHQESCDLFAYELATSGFMVFQAADGEEGLLRVQRFKPDVIVLDLVLPGLSGFAVARVVRGLERSKNIAIVAVSGLTSTLLRTEALAAGCDVFLGKPVPPMTVVEQARLHLMRRQSTPPATEP
jgi:DNA-binding response OmpR family regulator